MKTKIRDRKTPHAVTANLYGGQSTDKVWIWCFADDDREGKTIKKHVPMTNAYVAVNRQDLPDDKFRKSDMRKYHVDVWNQMSYNHRTHGKFMTNFELKEYRSRADLSNFLE